MKIAVVVLVVALGGCARCNSQKEAEIDAGPQPRCGSVRSYQALLTGHEDVPSNKARAWYRALRTRCVTEITIGWSRHTARISREWRRRANASRALAQAQDVGADLSDLVVEQLRIRHALGIRNVAMSRGEERA